MSSKVLYIVPAYNEEENIEETLAQIKEYKLDNSEMLVVNDSSDDDTASVAERAGATVLTHPINLGGGAAVRTGFKYAVEQGFDYTLQIDGDGQHDPKYAEDVLETVRSGEADMCIGSRFLKNPGYRIPLVRLAGIKTYSWIVSMFSGQKVTDCTSGYRAVDRDLFSKFAGNYPDSFCTIESAIWAGRRDYNIEEVPVEMSERDGGSSYLSPLRLAKYPFSMLYAIIRAL